MCFGGGTTVAAPASTPAAAPAPPDPLAEQVDVESPRTAEDKANFGTTSPDLRVDRSVSSGGVSAGGAGLRM